MQHRPKLNAHPVKAMHNQPANTSQTAIPIDADEPEIELIRFLATKNRTRSKMKATIPSVGEEKLD